MSGCILNPRMLTLFLLSLCGPLPAAELDPGNVHKLVMAWTYRTAEPTVAASGGGRPPAFEATPVYADGILYIGTPYGHAIALDPRNGKEVWRFDAKINLKGSYGDFANRGVSTWVDSRKPSVCARRIFLASIDARLFAIDARTGKLCGDFGVQGELDLTKGLRRGPSYAGEYEQTSPPAVIDDLVIVGSAIADNNRQDAPTGEVRAFDARTAELRWTWHPLPPGSPAGGANTWSVIVADPANHLLFLPTGSASPDYYGGLRPGDNRHANSIVALDSRTGKLVWSFQTVHHDLWDYDVASPPRLFTVRRGGVSIPAVAAGSKTGHLFLLHRLTGKPLFPVEERNVPKSDVPGEEASPTQPFPSAPPSLAKQSMGPEDAWGPTEADRESCRQQIASLRNEGIFTPPSLRGTLVVPGNIGGLHWGGVAFDEKTGFLVAPVNQFAAAVRLVPREQFAEHRKTHNDWETTGQRGTPFAMSRQFLRSPSGLPCNPPPFGILSGVDPVKGEIRWQVPLGQLPKEGAQAQWGSINLGGPLAAGNRLVFIGATLDPSIRAFDALTGRELWRGELPASARSTPITFVGPDKKQYIVIAAGGHESTLGKIDNALVAFRLP